MKLNIPSLVLSWLDHGALSNVDAPGCARYVDGSRPDKAQIGRFSSWGTVVHKGFLAKSGCLSSRISHSTVS